MLSRFRKAELTSTCAKPAAVAALGKAHAQRLVIISPTVFAFAGIRAAPGSAWLRVSRQ